MSASRAEVALRRPATVLAWTRQRFGLVRFAPLIAIVVLAGGVGTSSEPARLWRDLIVAALALFAWRLWDDLASREEDRGAHPERISVLATGDELSRLKSAAGTSAGLAALVAFLPAPSIAPAIVFAMSVMLIARGEERRPGSGARLRELHWTLLKYPALVLAVRLPDRTLDVPSLAAAASLYSAVAAFDLIDDSPSAAASSGVPRDERFESVRSKLLWGHLAVVLAAVVALTGTLLPVARMVLVVGAAVLLVVAAVASRRRAFAALPLFVVLAVLVSQLVWRPS